MQQDRRASTHAVTTRGVLQGIGKLRGVDSVELAEPCVVAGSPGREHRDILALSRTGDHLEALASGLPVIASARAGGAEVITEGVTGAVVKPTDAGAITSALERFRERPEGEVTQAARGAAEPYTYAAQVHGFAEVYAQVARARSDIS